MRNILFFILKSIRHFYSQSNWWFMKWFIKLVHLKVSQPKDIHPYTRPTCKVIFNLRKIIILALVWFPNLISFRNVLSVGNFWYDNLSLSEREWFLSSLMCSLCAHPQSSTSLPWWSEDHDILDELDDQIQTMRTFINLLFLIMMDKSQ